MYIAHSVVSSLVDETLKLETIILISLQYMLLFGQTVLFNLSMATGLGEGKLWIQPS